MCPIWKLLVYMDRQRRFVDDLWKFCSQILGDMRQNKSKQVKIHLSVYLSKIIHLSVYLGKIN